MKRFFILTALLAILGLSSCEKEPSKAIVGTWKATTAEMSIGGIKMEVDITEMGGNIEFTFKKDGTGHATLSNDEVNETANLTYSVAGNMLTITVDGETHAFPFSIEENHMTLTFSDEFLEEEGATSLLLHLEKQ